MKVAYNILHKLGSKQEPMLRPGDRVSEGGEDGGSEWGGMGEGEGQRDWVKRPVCELQPLCLHSESRAYRASSSIMSTPVSKISTSHQA